MFVLKCGEMTFNGLKILAVLEFGNAFPIGERFGAGFVRGANVLELNLVCN
jgi:hypothetical protein